MANIIKSEEIEKYKHKIKIYNIFYYIFTITLSLLILFSIGFMSLTMLSDINFNIIYLKNNLTLIIACMFMCFTLYYIIFDVWLKIDNRITSGFYGEQLVIEVLKNLSDDYTIFWDKTIITNDGKSNQLDIIVVGPTGVFIIETKNHKGTIRGTSDDYELIQSKFDSGGSNHKKNFYNPFKQVATHTYRLSTLFKENKMNQWVDNGVVFANKKAKVKVKLSNSKHNLFSFRKNGKNELLEFIQTNKNKENDTQKIIEVINKN